jgi:hypothetical protein
VVQLGGVCDELSNGDVGGVEIGSTDGVGICGKVFSVVKETGDELGLLGKGMVGCAGT